ncbi:MAG: hypothetical protein J5675_04905 [Bacteroidales bacterium]|nr:hypothetical protein [Bacteroidales bacterium]
MRKAIILAAAAIAVFASCRTNTLPPRPTIPLVESIARDTSGLATLVARAGDSGANGSIAIIGEPAEAVALTRLFLGMDAADNIDGRAVRDSLPDFAGEQFDAILDVMASPFGHFVPQMIDSLREAAVQGAMFAWDSTFHKSVNGRVVLPKSRAKILVFSSPLQSKYGLFDVDTLQQLCSGKSKLLSPVATTIADAVGAGAENIAVWASRELRASQAYEEAFAASGASGSLVSVTPESAFDIRTSLRSLLRQYSASGKRLDAIILSEYNVDKTPLLSEISLIRSAGTEEDQAFSHMLSPNLLILDPGTSLTRAVYRYMRANNLFTHRIALPSVRWFETTESDSGESVITEVGSAYVHSAYVPDFD